MNNKIFQNDEYLQTRQRFKEYYQAQIYPQLLIHEKKRLKKLKNFIVGAMITIAWLFIHYTMIPEEILKSQILGPILHFVDILFAVVTGLPVAEYYHETKKTILQIMIKFFGDFSYGYEKKISPEIINDSQIMASYDKINFDDCFSGMYREVPVMITEYGLYIKTIVEKDGYSTERYIKKFNGILFYAKMNKSFKGQTIVTKDSLLLNRFRRFKNRDKQTGTTKRLERVGLESPSFERKFEVYSDNQIEARYILTTVLIEHMMKLTESFPNIKFCFKNDHILMNIEKTENMFECSSFFSTLLKYKRIEKNFNEFYELFMIIDTLRLNQKHFL